MVVAPDPYENTSVSIGGKTYSARQLMELSSEEFLALREKGKSEGEFGSMGSGMSDPPTHHEPVHEPVMDSGYVTYESVYGRTEAGQAQEAQEAQADLRGDGDGMEVEIYFKRRVTGGALGADRCVQHVRKKLEPVLAMKEGTLDLRWRGAALAQDPLLGLATNAQLLRELMMRLQISKQTEEEPLASLASVMLTSLTVMTETLKEMPGTEALMNYRSAGK